MRRTTGIGRVAKGVTGGLVAVGAALLTVGAATPAAAAPICLDVLGIVLCLGEDDPPPAPPPTSPPPIIESPAPTEPEPVPSTPPPAVPPPTEEQPPPSGQAPPPSGVSVATETAQVPGAAQAPIPTVAPTRAPSASPSPGPTGAAIPLGAPPQAGYSGPAAGAASVTSNLTVTGATLLLIGSVTLAVLIGIRLRMTRVPRT